MTAKSTIRFAALAAALVALGAHGACADPSTDRLGSTLRQTVTVDTSPDAAAGAPSSQPAHCASDPDKLGVSRVVEIDAKDGPELGGSHGGRIDFLADREVVLTFDDGPMRAYTRRVLKALADECTLATFFMVGRMAVADPAMVREVAAAGHTVGSHTWSHKNMAAIGAAAMQKEFELGASAVNRANGGNSAPFFRFPYLSESKSAEAFVKSRGHATFWIDVDTKDYQTRSPEAVRGRVMEGLARTGKGIILFHDIQISTVKVLPSLLAELRAKGYKIVHTVPREGASTVADYDVQADKLLAGKSRDASKSPLSDRSVVWSQQPSGAEAPAHSSDGLPWSPVVKRKPAAAQPQRPNPDAAKPRELPLQNQIFHY